MQIETEIEIKFRTTLGDYFEDDTDEETIKALVEQHIQDFCNEHHIERTEIKTISQTKTD